MRSHSLLLTCEHAANRVPPSYAGLFRPHDRLRASHRGWDPGALGIAQFLSRELRAPLVAGRFTRLLVDLNRTEDHPQVYSEITRSLSPAERELLLERFHRPHWRRVHRELARRENVLHLGVHTFTPVLHGHRRSTGIGFLHDPSRPAEARFCRQLQAVLRRLLRVPVHRNLPYRGTGNGLITSLRRERFPGYVGVELEVRNSLAQDPAFRRTFGPLLAAAIRETGLLAPEFAGPAPGC